MAKFEISAFTDEYSQEFDKQIEGMLKTGVKYTEIRSVDGKNVSLLTEDEAKEVKRKLDANGLKVWSVGSPLGKIKLTDDIDAHIELTKHVCELANIFDTKNIRAFSFYVPDTKNTGDVRGQVFDYMGRMLDVADKAGVVLCHENEKGIYGEQVEGCVDIMEYFGGKYKCVFDPANFVQADVETFPNAFGKLEKYIYYMHIKDAKPDKTMTTSGNGIGHIAEILGALNETVNDTIFLTVEPHLKVFAGLRDLEFKGERSLITDQYATNEEAFTAAVNALRALL